MCGRFSLTSGQDEIAKLFSVDAFAAIPPRYNIAPTQPILAVRGASLQHRELVALEWGLVPEWAREKRAGKPLINARVETITEKASFRSAVKRTRCLVPFTSWYEWRSEKGRKQPYMISKGDGEQSKLAAFAGIWTTWHGPEGEHWLETVALVTAEATGPLRAVHHRKPLVVHPNSYQHWLQPHDPLPRDFWQGLQCLEEADFAMRPVDSAVNSIRIDAPRCHDSPKEDPQTSLFD